MKTKASLPTLIFLFTIICSIQAQPIDASQAPIALKGITVVDITEGQLIPDRTVVITNQHISELSHADSLSIPGNATIINAEGKYLIPGLWDMHTHVTDLINLPLEAKKTVIDLLVTHGVTGIREMGGMLSQVNKLRELNSNEEIFTPEIVAAGPYVDDDPAVWPNSVPVDTDAEAQQTVRMLNQRNGIDFIKVYGKISREAYFAIAEEANRLGIPFAGHLPLSVSLKEATEAGQRSFEHGDTITYLCTKQADELQKQVLAAREPDSRNPETLKPWLIYSGMDKNVMASFDPNTCTDLLDHLAQKDIWVTPTLTVFNGLSFRRDSTHTDKRFETLHPAYQKYWDQRSAPPDSVVNLQDFFESRLGITNALQKGEVSLLAGTDMPDLPFTFPGSSLHDELELMVQAGLTPNEALRTATINPAKYLSRSYELGHIEMDNLADLVLLDGNPLEDINNVRDIHAVVLRGKLLDRSTLDDMLEDVKEKVATYKLQNSGERNNQ